MLHNISNTRNQTIPSILDQDFSNTHPISPLSGNFCVKGTRVSQGNFHLGMRLIRLNYRKIGFSDRMAKQAGIFAYL